MPTMNQQLVFAGSYAKSDQAGIHAFNFDAASGALTPCGSFAGIVNPTFLAHSKTVRAVTEQGVTQDNGLVLYAVSETSLAEEGGPGTVWALRVEREPASDLVTIKPLNHQPSQGGEPCHLALDATGRWLIVSNYGTGSVGVLPVLPDGSLGEMTDHLQHHGSSGVNAERRESAGRQDGPHAHSTTFVPDNRFAIVADLGLDQLVVYKFDAATGKLSAHGHALTRPGAGPRHTTFHPNAQIVYVANELDSTVTAYAWDATNGELRELQTLDTLPSGGSSSPSARASARAEGEAAAAEGIDSRTAVGTAGSRVPPGGSSQDSRTAVGTAGSRVPPGAPENYVADIHISAEGKRLYVSNRGHNSIAVFDVDAAGRLARVAVPSCGGNWPRNFALAPAGTTRPAYSAGVPPAASAAAAPPRPDGVRESGGPPPAGTRPPAASAAVRESGGLPPGGRFMLVANQYSDEVAVLQLLDGPDALGTPLARVAAPQACCVEFVK
jgi:6-phosphogluconolactonase